MRRGSAFIAILLVLSAVSLGAHATFPPSGTCSVASSYPTIAANSVTPDSVSEGQVKNYKLVVPSGTPGTLAVQMFNGDVDIAACKVGSIGKPVCYSHNEAGVFDGCGFSDENVDPYTTWSPALAPGTYHLMVQHCFSSKDDGACDYTQAGAPTDGTLAGKLDGLPPIQYLIAYEDTV